MDIKQDIIKRLGPDVVEKKNCNDFPNNVFMSPKGQLWEVYVDNSRDFQVNGLVCADANGHVYSPDVGSYNGGRVLGLVESIVDANTIRMRS